MRRSRGPTVEAAPPLQPRTIVRICRWWPGSPSTRRPELARSRRILANGGPKGLFWRDICTITQNRRPQMATSEARDEAARIAAFVAQRRRELGVTQHDLAELAGVSPRS